MKFKIGADLGRGAEKGILGVKLSVIDFGNISVVVFYRVKRALF